MKLNLTSLGCAKNLVDSEIMLARLEAAGWEHTSDPGEAEVLIINTCSFIESAANESIDTILELAELKRTGSCQRLIVTGCLPQRYGEDIQRALPEVDVFLGVGAFDRITAAATAELNGCCFPDLGAISYPESIGRKSGTPYKAYLKIAEGCSRHCTYCIIPKLRGVQRSRSPERIIAEARSLIAAGAKELILVAQDTTHYGYDLGLKSGLATLLDQLAALNDQVWIRFLYGHPESFTPDIIRAVSARNNICPYFDVPIQHASDSVLKRMGRRYAMADLTRLFEEIRRGLPDAALRTTVITGFPGETDNDVEILLNFMERIRFDHLGVFCYSDAEDLPSHRLEPKIPPKIAAARRDAIMARQMDISLDIQQKYLGRELVVLVEEASEKGIYIGRTAFQSPEVDGLVFIRAASAPVGEFVGVRIIDALEYDLMGELI